MDRHSWFFLSAVVLLSGACSSVPERASAPPPIMIEGLAPVAPVTVVPPPAPVAVPVKVGLVLGGGAARGFAHVGVIKALEANGIVPDIVVGTSAGSLVGALYSYGLTGAQLQKLALTLDEDQVGDWGLPDRGVLKGQALQNFVNRAVHNQPLEKLQRSFGVVATDLGTGEQLLFRTGNTGMAVRASSAVPGIFQPVTIAGRDYVDGGLTSPVPVRAAREMGADFVIAVDISAQPKDGRTDSLIEVLMQTFTIMGQSLSRIETRNADVLIRPALSVFSATDFKDRKRVMAEGEKAGLAALASIRTRLEAMRFPSTVGVR